MSHKLGEWHSDAKKIEAVTSYLVLGKSSLVEATTGIPSGTIRRWKQEPWWADLVSQIQTEDNQELDSKLSSRVSKALDIVADRLDNGDFMFDPRTGTFQRRPVSLKDTWKVNKEMIDLRLHLRKQRPVEADQEAVADILKNLAVEFGQMARKRLTERVIEGEVVDGTQLQAGIPEVSGQIGSNPQTVPSEPSASPA